MDSVIFCVLLLLLSSYIFLPPLLLIIYSLQEAGQTQSGAGRDRTDARHDSNVGGSRVGRGGRRAGWRPKEGGG